MRIALIILASALTIQPALAAERGGLLRLVAERQPDLQRRCIPGPHEPGRTRRMPGLPATSAASWFYSKSLDAYPHCRYDSQAEADRAARQGDPW